MVENVKIGLREIELARASIRNTIRETPVNYSESLSDFSGVDVFLKLEHHQRTGSFKLRGAANAVLSLSEYERQNGVVGVSTGNHGRGLAYAAKQNNVKCIVCMSSLVPANKVEGIKAQGAEVRIVGASQDEAQIEVDRLVSEEGMTLIPPFDHSDIICGQGTLGIELTEQIPDLETAIIPVSGGGLISGVAVALKAMKPQIKIIGVSMDRGAAMYESQKAGKPVLVEELPTLADSLGGGVGIDNKYTFDIVRELVDEIVLVEEQEIASAVRHAYWQEKQIVEGSGSVSIAALLASKIKPKGATACLLTGCNLDMNLHHRIINGEDVDIAKE